MKKILIPLLVLMLLCMSIGALAEGQEAVTLEVNTAKLPLYTADDPYLNGLAEQGSLPVLVLQVKKSLQLPVTVLPKTLKNRKFTLSVDNEEIVRVKGNAVTGLKPGETVLTIASDEDPSATLQYRIAVIQPVTRITVTAPEKSVAVGGTIQLTSAALPEDATKQQVTWTSADERIATVDENGVVTGVKRGTARITATATDGSKIRTSISLAVAQMAEEITLDKDEVTVDVGRTAVIKAMVLPKDTNDKGVIWSSSDEGIAKVDKSGRVTAVALGECEIIGTSKTTGTVQAKAVVHVQQPVKKVTFDEAPAVYANESAQLTWHVEPEDASNKNLTFKSSNEKVLTVNEDGTVTGVGYGKANVIATTTDGSKRQAKVQVSVLQHVTGVHMYRHTAYIDIGASNLTRAIVEPDKGTNHNMAWESADESIATVEKENKQPSRAKIRGISEGETTVTVTTEDGGFQASLLVKVGNFENSLKWVNAEIDGRGNLLFRVKNVSDLNITRVTLEVTCMDDAGNPVMGVNTKDGTNVLTAVYNKRVDPGATTNEFDGWKIQDRDDSIAFRTMDVRIVEFEIDHDWVKLIRKNHQPVRKYRP